MFNQEEKERDNALIKRSILTNCRYYIFLGIIVFCSLLTLYTNIGDFSAFSVGYPNLFIYANAFGSNIIWILAPAIPVLIVTNRIKEELIADKLQLKKIFYYSVIGASVFFVAYIIELILFFIIDPANIAFPIRLLGMYAEVLSNSSLLFVGCYIIHVIVWSFAFAFFGIVVFIRLNSPFYAVLFPIIVYRITTYFPVSNPYTRITILEYILPNFPFEITGFDSSLIENAIQFICLFSVSIAIVLNTKRIYERGEIR